MRNDPMSKEPRSPRTRRTPGESVTERIAGRSGHRAGGPGSRFFHRFGIQDPYQVASGGGRVDRLIAGDTGPFTYLSAEGYRADVREVRYHLLERLSHERTTRRLGERLARVGPAATAEGLVPKLLAAAPTEFTTLVDTPTIVEVEAAPQPGRNRPARTPDRRKSRSRSAAKPAPALAPTAPPPRRLGAPPVPRSLERRRAPIPPATAAVRRVAPRTDTSRLLRALVDALRGTRRTAVEALIEQVERGDLGEAAPEVAAVLARLPAATRARARADEDVAATERVGLRRVTARSPSVRALERRAPGSVLAAPSSPVAADTRSSAEAPVTTAAGPSGRRRPRRRVGAPAPAPRPTLPAPRVSRAAPTAAAARRALEVAPSRPEPRLARVARRAEIGVVARADRAPLASAVAPEPQARMDDRWIAVSDTPPTRRGRAPTSSEVVDRPTARALARLAVPAGDAIAAPPMAHVVPADGPRPEATESPVARRTAQPAPARPRARRSPPAATRVATAIAPPVRRAAPAPRPPAPLDLRTGRAVATPEFRAPARVRARTSSPPARRAELRGEPVVTVADGRRSLVPRPAAHVAAAPAATGEARWVSAPAPVVRRSRARPVDAPRGADAVRRATAEAAEPAEAPLGHAARAAVRDGIVSRVDRRGRPLAAPVAVTPEAPKLLERVFAAAEAPVAALATDRSAAVPSADPSRAVRGPVRERGGRAAPETRRGRAPRPAPSGTEAGRGARDREAIAPTSPRTPAVRRRPVSAAPSVRPAQRAERAAEPRSILARPVARGEVAAAPVADRFTVATRGENEPPERLSPAVRAAVRDRATLRVDGEDRVRAVPAPVGPTWSSRPSRLLADAAPIVLAPVRPALPAEEPQVVIPTRPGRRSPSAPRRTARRAVTAPVQPVSTREPSRSAARPLDAAAAVPVAGPLARASARAVDVPSATSVLRRALPVLTVERLLAALGELEPAPAYRADRPDRGEPASARRESRPAPVAPGATRAPRRTAAPPVWAAPNTEEAASGAEVPALEARVRAAVHAALRTQRPAALTSGTRRLVQSVAPAPARRVGAAAVAAPGAPPRIVEARVVLDAEGRLTSARAVRTTDAAPIALALPELAAAAAPPPAERASTWAERRTEPGRTPGARAARRAVAGVPTGRPSARSAGAVDAVLPVGLGSMEPAALPAAAVDAAAGGRRPLSASLAELSSPTRRSARARGARRDGARRDGARRQNARGIAAEPTIAHFDADGEAPSAERGAPRDRQWARRTAEGGLLAVPDRLARTDERDERESRGRTAGGLLTALARSGDPEEVVRVILERSSSVASAASSLGAEARSLVDRIVRTAGAEREQRVSAQVQSLPQVRTVTRRILTPAPSQTRSGSGGHTAAGATSTQGVGASGVMKLAGKLMKLIHLAENERRKADAQREVRMAEETGSTRREAGAGQTGGENVASQTMNLKVLQQQVLDSILQKLEEQRWRRDDPDGPNSGS